MRESYLHAVSVILFIAYLPYICGLRCYKCYMTAPNPSTNEIPRMCNNFDYSEKYIVDCPYSTFCMKKDFTVKLTAPINGTIRDCASQKYDYQDYRDGKWTMQVSIEEPYTEGCSTVDDKGFRSSRTQFCYCKGDLCNAAHSNTANLSLLLSVILFTHACLKFATHR